MKDETHPKNAERLESCLSSLFYARQFYDSEKTDVGDLYQQPAKIPIFRLLRCRPGPPNALYNGSGVPSEVELQLEFDPSPRSRPPLIRRLYSISMTRQGSPRLRNSYEIHIILH